MQWLGCMDELLKAAISLMFWGGVIFVIAKIVGSVRNASKQREEANRRLAEIEKRLGR